MLRSDAENARWLWLILLGGMLLRLYGLGSESFWLDEVVTADRVHESFQQITFGWDSETQGPLYYLWVKCWGLMLGTEEWILRIWSVIWGTLTIWFVYHLGKQLFSNTAAMLAAFFVAIHPFAIHYSQEARPYALFLLLAAASYYYLLVLMRQHRWPLAWLYILAAAGAYYTHAFGTFLILSHVLMFWWFRHGSRFRSANRYSKPFIQTLLLLMLLCLPEIAQNSLAALSKIAGTSQAGWIPVPGILDLVKMPVEYFMNETIGLIVLIIAALFASIRVVSEPQLRTGFQWLLILAVCFWLVPWIVSITVTPLFVLRYSAPALLAIVFLMAAASASLQALPRLLFVALLAGLTSFPLWDYYTKVDKDPWRQTAQHLSDRVKPDDAVFALPHFTQGALRFYLPSDLRAQLERPTSVSELENVLSNHERVWQVTSYDINDSVGIALLNLLESWSSSVRTVSINDELGMNPHRFWSAPVSVTLRQQDKLPLGPQPLPAIDL